MRTTLTSAPACSSRCNAAGAVSSIRRTRTRPPSGPRSHTITPGVVKPVIPTFTPARSITLYGAYSSVSVPPL